MSAIDVLNRIVDTALYPANLKYCLVASDKMPLKIDGSPIHTNQFDDFVDFDELLTCENLEDYAGVGISIQASNVHAIDIDHCFSEPNNINSADSRAIDALKRFENLAYCEFSFSGTGMRIIFRQPLIENYSTKYYIKNEKVHIEYYQPTRSYRYVTVTGNVIVNQTIDNVDFTPVITQFLDDYMKRGERPAHKVNTTETETRSFEDLMKVVKYLYFKNATFQNLWFGIAPGSGKNESELDYQLLAMLYENVTQDEEMLLKLFEESPYFKTKDRKHIFKWENQEHRYFKYMYSIIGGTK